MSEAPSPRTKASAKGHHSEIIVVKRGSRHAHDEHGGAWKVAFADFCLALLSLFLVMWILGIKNEEELKRAFGPSATGWGMASFYDGGLGMLETDVINPVQEHSPAEEEILENSQQSTASDMPDTTASVSESASLPVAFESKEQRQGNGGNDQAEVLPYLESKEEMRVLARQLNELAIQARLQGNLHSIITPTGLRVMLHDTQRRGIFDLGNANPNPMFEKLLHQIGELFSKMENSILIVGHTDSTPFRTHTTRSNWQLSTERATAVQRILQEGGMPFTQVLQVAGMADQTPIDPEDKRAAVNRRIEFLILTRTRARSLEQMFGKPTVVYSLMEGVHAADMKGLKKSEHSEISREFEKMREVIPNQTLGAHP